MKSGHTTNARDAFNIALRLTLVASGLTMMVTPFYVGMRQSITLGVSVGVVGLPVGFLAAYFGLRYVVDVVEHIQRKKAILGRGERVVARLEALQQPGAYTPGLLRAVGEVDGESVTFEEPYVVGSQTEGLEEGDAITVEYDPQQPEVFVFRYDDDPQQTS